MQARTRIVISILAALFIAILVTKTLFLSDSPRINTFFITSIPEKTRQFLAKYSVKKIEPTGSPGQSTIPSVYPTSTQLGFIGMWFPKPTLRPAPTTPNIYTYPTPKTNIPTPIIFPTTRNTFPSPTTTRPFPTSYVTPTNIPFIYPTFAPPVPTPTTVRSTSGCITSSSQQYDDIGTDRSSGDMPLIPPVEESPEINLHLRGFGPTNKSTNLLSRNGNNYGLDDQMPPQISSLFGGPVPQIVQTYDVYEWDFDNKVSRAPARATPNYEVHLVGLSTTPGQQLLGLRAGRDIGGGNVFMVLYATPTEITFTHSNGDSLLGGYLFYFVDFCVDPNLLAKYQAENASGRGRLPVIRTGQVFGYGNGGAVKVGIRDTMSFVDPRYKEDWWFYGQ